MAPLCLWTHCCLRREYPSTNLSPQTPPYTLDRTYDFLIGVTFPAPQTVRLFVTIFGTSHTSVQALNSMYSHCSIRGLALLIWGELPMYLFATGTVPSTQHVLLASWADESSAQQKVGRGGLRRPLEGSPTHSRAEKPTTVSSERTQASTEATSRRRWI